MSAGTLTSFLLYTMTVAFSFAFISSLFGDFMQTVFMDINNFLNYLIRLVLQKEFFN